MSKRAPIKIPKLYPEETITIGKEKIVIREYKPMDKPFVIAIQALQKELQPVMKKIGELQVKINKLILDEDGNQISDKELEEKGIIDEVYKITDEVNNLKEDIDKVADQLIEGDSEEDEFAGPAYFLAQRGLKRFYYPDTTSTELDELPNIEIGKRYVTIISNTMIELANPPSGLEQSIRFEERKKADDKGKQDA